MRCVIYVNVRHLHVHLYILYIVNCLVLSFVDSDDARNALVLSVVCGA